MTGIEYVLTHQEYYSKTYSEGAVKIDDSPYWFSIRPTGPLLPKSEAHRQKRIDAWKQFAAKAGVT